MILFMESCTRIICGGGFMAEERGKKSWDPLLAPRIVGCVFSADNSTRERLPCCLWAPPFPTPPPSIHPCCSGIWPWFSVEASPTPFVYCCLVWMWSWKPGIQVLFLSFILTHCVTFFFWKWVLPVWIYYSSHGCCIWVSRNINEFVCEIVPPGKYQPYSFQRGNWVTEGDEMHVAVRQNTDLVSQIPAINARKFTWMSFSVILLPCEVEAAVT